MSTRTLSRYDTARQKHGTKLDPLQSYSLRVTAELWQRTKWQAAAESMGHGEWLRAVLDDAARKAIAPESTEILTIRADKERAEKWSKLFAELNDSSDTPKTLGDHLGDLLDKWYSRKFPTENEAGE